MLDTFFFVIQYRTFVAKLTVIGARNGALKLYFRYRHWWSLFLNSTFASIDLRPHGHVAMMSFRTETDITCPDRWIQVMCHYRVLIGVPIKFLNRRETVGNNLAPSGSRKYERTSERASERANERTSERANKLTSQRADDRSKKRANERVNDPPTDRRSNDRANGRMNKPKDGRMTGQTKWSNISL